MNEFHKIRIRKKQRIENKMIRLFEILGVPLMGQAITPIFYCRFGSAQRTYKDFRSILHAGLAQSIGCIIYGQMILTWT